MSIRLAYISFGLVPVLVREGAEPLDLVENEVPFEDAPIGKLDGAVAIDAPLVDLSLVHSSIRVVESAMPFDHALLVGPFIPHSVRPYFLSLPVDLVVYPHSLDSLVLRIESCVPLDLVLHHHSFEVVPVLVDHPRRPVQFILAPDSLHEISKFLP